MTCMLGRQSCSRLARAALTQASSSTSTASYASLGSSLRQNAPHTSSYITRSRRFTTSIPGRYPSDDPGGKPNDGSHPTVYDDFNNITAGDEPQLNIHSMGDSSFTLSDGLVVHTPILLINKQVLLWDAPNLTQTPEKPIMPSGVGWEEWTDDVWKIFEVITPRPEIIVFGTGKTVLPAPPKLKAYLNKLGIQVEAHDTRNACSTYNLLIEEDRLVAAALIPPKRTPTRRVEATTAAEIS